MEKKERYVWVDRETTFDSDKLYDKTTGKKYDPVYATDLLNQQSNRIKELEEEIQQLKQSQKQLAISELEKVEDTVECVLNNALKNSSLNQSYYDKLLDEIDEQIEALKGV